ncbi:hypothetical protein ERO13_D12G206666v2 [Gossypium hirsutum]|uniref:Transcription elongation factor 1 homolog n=2 Tax=Gossypium TaxID=3633 RepID=A0A5J5P1Y4_GOSBA|nr:hypothetical protein ES319_D12G230200v1 [Gossypium barbadense]KAG4117085.1 hypothetical protein ERO13_D12G206666v2 [Gossypium hirsutum]TYG42281.1 hypothetical protein ES288_D12G243800v1 [Gossypium darwinii]
MGKRKLRAKSTPKKRMDKLDTVFSCPFCNHGTGGFFFNFFLIWVGFTVDIQRGNGPVKTLTETVNQ